MEWISVETRLPEKGKRVLTYSERFGVEIGAYHTYWATIPLIVAFEPTHWAELPPPPKED